MAGPLPRVTQSGAVTVRPAIPDDYDRVIGQVDGWWGGRAMAAMLPRLFFTHFHATSLTAETEDGSVVGFLCGFGSPSRAAEAYVHFIGVDPGVRGHGLGRRMYMGFAAGPACAGRHVVRAVTSPLNVASRRFHASLGFVEEKIVADYDGPGEDRVLLTWHLP